MDLFSIIGLIIVVLVVLSLGKIMSHLLRFLFYALLGALVLVFFFDISLNNIIDWLSSLVLWAF
ncbi:MAG: hypothetical protein KKA62_00990 [Nanoarchaeota archaeon]|nr:hypothetical protein [Nanoarchaeota archaeon]MBU1644506.1 hypothetical protein [Nanoarchaeota archaeon]MBU1976510.1 hypothetical protein [Nanoarchaeota archaeon]